MELRRPGVPEPPVEEHFRRAAEAGYHGLCIDPAVHEIAAMRALRPLYREYGLECMVNAFPRRREELVPLLDLAREMDAVLVNVIGQVMPMTIGEGVPVIRGWLADAAAAGLPLLFETHRDCTLNDLHYTLRLIEAVPEMRLCADLSHFVLDREMRLPLSEADRDSMHRILERSDCFQGRVSNAEQIQVPLGFPQHQAWVAQFREWWEQGMRMWRARNGEQARLVFLCELGPPPYAITDADGRELSDRWDEALLIRSWAQEAWRRAGP
ncbi:MAG: sugar phosphate isomerase/epimerase [Xanthomonadales bacterium]|nr:sugar phosphate isomerase/epimerase [Xanthomonadales bacterium]NIN58553.1 sugar phosphate isomerase/epimerase [Xanthomonadales bacterium]NIN73842.1 sugar phosphate isomerase/epimerase [Xanthomonadales bacterium]NIO12311.1 sugar phosphate isomerase/epimerase [Xanthomonadales bacterium]NIP10946.1 sugar phosphate isomerase/epimerase [Xanthomonadales bacterium]